MHNLHDILLCTMTFVFAVTVEVFTEVTTD